MPQPAPEASFQQLSATLPTTVGMALACAQAVTNSLAQRRMAADPDL